jgi:site-specific DNA-methyltransferase (adenine-specific)
MAVNIEDAGFEIRDMIAWVYGQGFPKSLDVSKAIDKAAGVEFKSIPAGGVGFMNAEGGGGYNPTKSRMLYVGDSTDAAKQWQGWGTALKPALEPITMARKPFAGTVAGNVLAHGTGAINVDGCRVACADAPAGRTRHGGGIVGNGTSYELPDYKAEMPAGRWPANLIHDGSEEVTDIFPGEGEGSAARFFYCAKASKSGRGDGNDHPTVKPLDLMRYLVRLVCRPGGTVLEPFMGSGTTLLAARLEGMRAIGIEREQKYCDIAVKRLAQQTIFQQPSP